MRPVGGVERYHRGSNLLQAHGGLPVHCGVAREYVVATPQLHGSDVRGEELWIRPERDGVVRGCPRKEPSLDVDFGFHLLSVIEVDEGRSEGILPVATEETPPILQDLGAHEGHQHGGG